ncbi:MAG: MFS transporter [bacterium]
MPLEKHAAKPTRNPPHPAGGIRSHAVLSVLFLLYMSDYVVRYVPSGMIEFLKNDWSITDAQAGSLISIVLLFITIFTIPASILIDRWSRRKMIGIMAFLWSLACLSCACTKSYTQLLVARAFLGVGEAGYAPGGIALLAAAYPEEKRARVLGLWNVSIPLGVGIGLMAGGQIAKAWGWQAAFVLVALPGFLLALAAWFLPDYRTVRVEVSGAGAGSLSGFLSQAAGILRVRGLLFTYLGFAMNVATSTALMTWLPSYFERTGVVPPGEGGMYTMPIFALILVGAPLGGFLSDAWHRRRKEARPLFAAGSSVAAAVVLLAALLLEGSKAQLGVLGFYGICAAFFVAPGTSVTQDLSHPGLRAVSYGMCVIIQHLCGDVWSPWLVGAASDRFGLSQALMLLPILGILGGLFFYGAARHYVRDRSRVERVELRID